MRLWRREIPNRWPRSCAKFPDVWWVVVQLSVRWLSDNITILKAIARFNNHEAHHQENWIQHVFSAPIQLKKETSGESPVASRVMQGCWETVRPGHGWHVQRPCVISEASDPQGWLRRLPKKCHQADVWSGDDLGHRCDYRIPISPRLLECLCRLFTYWHQLNDLVDGGPV